MRDFNNLDLILKIENNPLDYIIHRKVSLLQSYLFGYEYFLLKIKDVEILKDKYKNVPSMDEYGRIKYNGRNIGTRNITSIISYNCENEIEYYDNYLQFIKEYEEKYILEENVVYMIKDEEKYTTENILKAIKTRYPTYFGTYNLENFRAFFDGYIKCKKDYDITIDNYENGIIGFLKTIKCEILNMEGKYITWDRKYRYNKDANPWGEMNGNSGKEIVNNFFTDLEKYIGKIKV
jgi:hypothetical protein